MMDEYNQISPQYVEILPKSVLNSCDVCGECNSKFNYIIDKSCQSWNSLDSKVINFLNCKIYRPLKKINIFIYLVIIIILFIVILKRK